MAGFLSYRPQNWMVQTLMERGAMLPSFLFPNLPLIPLTGHLCVRVCVCMCVYVCVCVHLCLRVHLQVCFIPTLDTSDEPSHKLLKSVFTCT